MHVLLTSSFNWQVLQDVLRDWRSDLQPFLHHDLPKLVLVVAVSLLATRLLRAIAGRIGALKTSEDDSHVRSRQLKTLAGVVNSVGSFAIWFVALLMVLALLGLNLAPLLASAGIAGLAIGFGAQTLVKDVINGFFILLENQYGIGDIVRVAGVRGTVEELTLRRTVLRDEDGTLHVIPNSEVRLVSNTTRDWTQVALRTTAAYGEDSDRIIALLQETAKEMAGDGKFSHAFVTPPRVLGVDRVANGEAEYLLVARVRPETQFEILRELRRRIKVAFENNRIQPGAPARVYIRDGEPTS